MTGRSLLVYFSQLSQQIGHTDPDDISEIIQGLGSSEADLFIQTPGGSVDATEKIISVLQKSLADYRVIVPSWAKSAGTVIAISSREILLGVNSELGPIDPQFPINGNLLPAELLAADPAVPQHLRAYFENAAQRMRKMAGNLLRDGMLAGSDEKRIDDTITKISSTKGYLSHGAVIDYDEARELGLKVSFLNSSDELWQRIWLLYCIYDHDCRVRGIGKVFEGSRHSLSRPL